MSGTAEQTIEGEVARITFENEANGFRVLQLALRDGETKLALVGTFPRVAEGTCVRVTGHFEVDAKYGRRFRAASLTELTPTTLVGLRRYLGSGRIPGVGEKYAQKIVDHFGLRTLQVLDENPERLTEVSGVGRHRARTIAKAWTEQCATRDVMVSLQAQGVGWALAQRIFRRYGAQASHIVRHDPYRLAIEIPGVGFKTADRIAQEVGIGRDSMDRRRAALVQAVRDELDAGHVYTAASVLIEKALALLSPDGVLLEPMTHALALLVHQQILVRENRDGTDAVYARLSFEAEVRVAHRLRDLASANVRTVEKLDDALKRFEAQSTLRLSDEQQAAIELAVRSAVTVITGGPGVGKTTIVRAVIAMVQGANLRVQLVAPTGRAAKRMTESTGREALTIHRLLEFEPRRGKFARHRDVPLDADVLIVDECSMVDLSLADALLDAVKNGTRLVLVGDVDQLPSVGPAAVLRDVIESGCFPTAKLARIFRQSSGSDIVTNAHKILHGYLPESSPGNTGEFFVIDRTDPDAARDTVVELVTKRIPHRFGFDPVTDIQVLTPMHRGPLGSIVLNETLQAALNPTGEGITRGGRTFRRGDKVMQLRNDYDRNVYNGDMGLVARIERDEGTVRVTFDGREVAYQGADLDDLMLAYACSVHKSQGSEYPAVVIPLLTTHFVMLSRNLLYTAVTRGKRLVVLVADPRAIRLAVGEERRDDRRTRLAHRLRDAFGRDVFGGTKES